MQLDDYPYVHLMRRVSQELRKLGQDGVFFDSDDLPMKEPRDWGTLIELLNEDFDDLVAAPRGAEAGRRRLPAAEWLLDRFDAARRKVGARPAFGQLDPAVRAELVAKALEAECAELLRDKNAGIPDTLEGSTVVIEFARGGPDGATHAAAGAARLPLLARRAVARRSCRGPRSSTSGSRPRSRGARTSSAPTPTTRARSCTTACRWR